MVADSVCDVIRVLVVDDDPMVRRLLRTILRPDDIDVVAEAGDGDDAVTQAQAHHPDVVLMDLRMPRVDGIRATTLLRALPSPPGVIAMTSFDTESAILDAVHAGADGFLAKDSSPEDIVAAVRAVALGDGWLSARAARTVMAQLNADPVAAASREAQQRLELLTDREVEIARAVTEGTSNAEIARQLFVSEATVKTHLARALDKLGMTSRVQLAVVVAKAGVESPV